MLIAWYVLRYIRDPFDAPFITAVDLVIHEGGHVVFSPFGEFVYIAGGSIMQSIVPLMFAGYFLLQRAYLSSALMMVWAGQNLAEVAYYARDAILIRMPLLGGDSVLHDWNYLLTALGILPHAAIVADVIVFCSLCAYAASFGLVCIDIYLSQKPRMTTAYERATR